MTYQPEVTITAARVDDAAGGTASYIERVEIGGGSQTVTVDGVAEDRTHPTSFKYHVRFISPDRMVPDQLRDAPSFEDACTLAIKYAENLNEHAKRVSELADDLKVD